ncbi:SRPBCC domain-containing protein [Intrasporangium mesophilum]
MSSNLTHTFSVDQSPHQVFDAITDVRAWWGNLVGDTHTVGAEWVYVVPDIHYTKFRTTELIPGELVEWVCVDSYLSFPEDKHEWTGTTVRFEITQPDGPAGRTKLTFTHVGLSNDVECYDVCNTAWGQYILGSLRDLVLAGAGRPMFFSNQESLDAALAGTVENPLVS